MVFGVLLVVSKLFFGKKLVIFGTKFWFNSNLVSGKNCDFGLRPNSGSWPVGKKFVDYLYLYLYL